MDDNIIRSSYDKKYVPKNLNKSLKTTTNEENIAEKKAKTTRKRTSTKKTTASKQTSKTVEPKKEKSTPSQVAVYSEGKLAHPALGRLTKGYNVVSKEQADEWMKLSKKVRLATPEEVAAAYEV